MYGNDTAALYEALDHPSLRLVKPLPKRRRVQVPSTTISTDKDADKSGSLGSEPHITPRTFTTVSSPTNTSNAPEIPDQSDTGSGVTPRHSTAVLKADGADVVDWSESHFHLNKKKRKTPNIGGRGMLEEHADDNSYQLDGGARTFLEQSSLGQPAYQITPTWNRDRLSQVTRAGMRQKELNVERKRIVSAAFDGDENYDPADVEQALSSGFLSSKTAPVRIYRTKKSIARSVLPGNEAPEYVPQGTFDFQCPSATSERSIKQGQQVSQLHSRFRDELDRLDLAVLRTVPAPPVKASNPSRSRSMADPTMTTVSDASSLLAGGKKKKKKKRSALANASNPHHLRNYVPSRLPKSGPVNSADTAQNLLSPLPVRFLNANLPPSDTTTPRTRGISTKTTSSVPEPPSVTDPSDEWICPFCEYNLFYGDERAFERALLSRKKVLRRRRRARDRAAAAANGKAQPTKAAGAGGHAAGDDDEEEDALFEPPHDDVPASITSQMKWKSVKDVDTRTRAG